MLGPRAEPLPQMRGLRLRQLPPVPLRRHGQGVFPPFPLQLPWTSLGRSPASRRQRIVDRLTPHAVAASRWVSIGRVIPLSSPPRPAPTAAPAGPVG